MIVFSLLYGVVSFTFAYYGEMITYLGMTAPMALFALISWMRNPYKRQPGGGDRKPCGPPGDRRYAGGGPCGDRGVFLHPPCLPHRQPAPQHHLRHHQLLAV